MFRAIDIETGQGVIILDFSDQEVNGPLRAQAHEGRLRCPGCDGRLVVRAGKRRRNHFAHKTLAGCRAGEDPIALFEPRALLYTWLKTKFDEGVEIERWPEDADLPHPIDCWVTRQDKPPLAYWLVASGRNPEYREAVVKERASSDAHWTVVHRAEMIKRGNRPKGMLRLSTTERDFRCASRYDPLYPGQWGPGGKSLHYLDTDAESLMTFRNTICTEPPQEYTGWELCTRLEQVQVLAATGEFVHPGEYEKWLEREKARRERERRREEEERRQEEERRKAREAEERHRRAHEREMMEKYPPHPTDSADWSAFLNVQEVVLPGKENKPPPLSPEAPVMPERTCSICGLRTRDYRTWSGDTCKCNTCRAAGRNG
jgi:hypothetical protein